MASRTKAPLVALLDTRTTPPRADAPTAMEHTPQVGHAFRFGQFDIAPLRIAALFEVQLRPRPPASGAISRQQKDRPLTKPASCQLQPGMQPASRTPGTPRAGGPAFCLVRWRWRWDLNPRRLAPHTLSRRAPSAARTRHRRKPYLISGKSSSRYSPSRGLLCSWPRSCTRRILPEIVLGSSANSSRRIRLYGASCSRA